VLDETSTIEPSPDQDVLDCLDHFLSTNGYDARIDTFAPIFARNLVFQFERRAKAQVARLLRSVQSAKRRPAHVFLNATERYGAFALRDRYDFIVLYISLVPIITDFCLRTMEHQGLWTHVGAGSNAPDDHTRHALSVVFASECFDFIVRHELAHLVHGHCEFRSSNGGPGRMEDIDGRIPPGADPITVQALEFAADCQAAIWGMQNLPLIRQVLGRRTGVVDEAYRAFHRTNKVAVRNYLLVLFFVFRLFYETTWSSEALAIKSHPPAPIRFHVVCMRLHEHFQEQQDAEALEHFTEAMQEVWELGEFIFAQSFDSAPDFNAKRQVMEQESEQHFLRVRERARTLPQSLFELF
jgi:hypothetical protein